MFDPEKTYTATISPWSGGWEIAVEGVGATQAELLGDVELMAQSLIANRYDLWEREDFDETQIRVQLVLSLEKGPHTGTRMSGMEVLCQGEPVTLLEQVTWSCQPPGLE